MRAAPLWEISVTTLPEAEEHIAVKLESFTSEPPVVCTDAETLRTTVSVFTAKKPSRELIGRLKAELQTPLTVRRIRTEDWAHSWKKHFKPFEIGSALLVKPSWSKRRAKKNQAVVVIDPGLSFGTGQHHTTRFCLEQLVRFRDCKRQTFLDVGTGSGILAIAAAKLGYIKVLGFDVDADAIRVAKENARGNGIASNIRLKQQDLAEVNRNTALYNVLCANLTADVLLKQRHTLRRCLAAGGILVLAGVLAKEFAQVKAAYGRSGLQMIATATEKPWQSAVFRRSI